VREWEFDVEAHQTKEEHTCPIYLYYYLSLSCFLGKIIQANSLQLPQTLPLTNRVRWKEFIHHEGTKNTKRKEIVALQDFGGRYATCGVLPSLLHAMARRRKEYWGASSIWGRPDCRGNR
jgi:hypothetical protein